MAGEFNGRSRSKTPLAREGNGFWSVDVPGALPEGWALLRWLNEEIQARQPWKFTIAEDLQGNPWMTKDIGAGGGGFSSQWDPQFVGIIRGAILGMADEQRDMIAVKAAVEAGTKRRSLTIALVSTTIMTKMMLNLMTRKVWRWLSRFFRSATCGAKPAT